MISLSSLGRADPLQITKVRVLQIKATSPLLLPTLAASHTWQITLLHPPTPISEFSVFGFPIIAATWQHHPDTAEAPATAAMAPEAMGTEAMGTGADLMPPLDDAPLDDCTELCWAAWAIEFAPCLPMLFSRGSHIKGRALPLCVRMLV